MNRWIKITLAVSLTFNLLLAGGYLYKRFVAYPRAQAEWATEALHLNAAQQADLLQFNAWVRSELKASLDDLKPDIATAKTVLVNGNADDERLAESMRHINDRRLKLQTDAIKRLFAFRDTLSPEQRQIFTRLAMERGFVLRMIGLGPQAERLQQ